MADMQGALPPASRIGQNRGELREIPANRLGRCPTCGEMCHMPCYACIVREHVKNNDVPKAEEVPDDEDEDDVLPTLMFR